MLNIKTYFLVILLLFTSACSNNKEDVENDYNESVFNLCNSYFGNL